MAHHLNKQNSTFEFQSLFQTPMQNLQDNKNDISIAQIRNQQ